MKKIADRTRKWNKEGPHKERFNALRVLQQPGTLRRLDRIQNRGNCAQVALTGAWIMTRRDSLFDHDGSVAGTHRLGSDVPRLFVFLSLWLSFFFFFFIYCNLPLNLGGEDSQPGGSHARILQLCRLQRKHDLWTFPGLMLWFTFLFVSAFPTHHFFFSTRNVLVSVFFYICLKVSLPRKQFSNSGYTMRKRA